nr:hypothetical protein B0A51_00249 [Rachicladosporium sp. CCFEE 5018]
MPTFTPLPRRSELARQPYTVDISDLSPEHSDCSICRSPLTEECEPMLFHGTHVFCKACIFTWFQQSRNCPNCRQPIWSRAGPDIQRLGPIVLQYLRLDPRRLPKNVLVFDEDFIETVTDLNSSRQNIKLALLEAVVSGEFLKELKTELHWINDSLRAMKIWRARMYKHAPNAVIWTPIEAGKDNRSHARGSQHRDIKICTASALQAMDRAIRNAPRTRDSNEVVTEQVRSVLSHPLRCLVIETLEDAVRDVDGTRQSAWKFYQYLQRRVNVSAPELLERVAQGKDEALVMQGFVSTLIVRVIEAQQKCKIKYRKQPRVMVHASEVQEQVEFKK